MDDTPKDRTENARFVEFTRALANLVANAKVEDGVWKQTAIFEIRDGAISIQDFDLDLGSPKVETETTATKLIV